MPRYAYILLALFIAGGMALHDPVASSMPVDWIIALGTLAAAAAAWLAALAARRSAEATHKAADAQLAMQFLTDYASQEMAAAILELERYAEETGAQDDVISWEDQPLELNVPAGERIDLSRRKVYWFFRNAWNLYEAGFLSKKTMQVIVRSNAYDTFHDVAAPIAYRSDHRMHKDEWFAWVGKMRDEFPPRRRRRIGEFMREAVNAARAGNGNQ